MSKTLAYGILVLFAVLSIVLIAARPGWVSDANPFLHGFINHEFLSLLGVILVITLASVANIHLEFNKIEERYQKRGLDKSRQNLKKNTYWLISLFAVAVALVIIKPLFDSGETAQAVANMGALLILVWMVLILVSLTQLVFAIGPEINESGPQQPQPPQGTEAETQP